ncbi:hypothetical protein [Tenacibaculum haliotis]|uniref:hypothetical protein n=1 Tax=Tenacibaculum haliotis TaxID=1888914 RepID=UPI0021AF5389|nr:hypothetical protein [Tenacibaculum haliotis]MCT4699314.1 hypothetical protein [Tenacibaculum haliotis]
MKLLNIAYTLMFISPVLYLIKYRKSFRYEKIRYFLCYVCLIALIEFFILFYRNFINEPGIFTNFIYNVLVFFEYNLIFLFYKDISKEKLTQVYIKCALIIFNIVYCVLGFYYGQEVMSKYIVSILVIGAILVSINFVLYLREFLLSDKILNYQKDITFWITVGFLLYYLGTLPLTAVSEFVYTENNIDVFAIQIVLTIIMHSCFIYGIITCWKKNI